MQQLLFVGLGLVIGVAASFTGLGGGFLMVPLLMVFGYTAQKAVGTSFLAILVISISALFAHNKLAHVDWHVGLLLGAGGVVGAQVGARIVDHVSGSTFRWVFAAILIGLAGYVALKK